MVGVTEHAERAMGPNHGLQFIPFYVAAAQGCQHDQGCVCACAVYSSLPEDCARTLLLSTVRLFACCCALLRSQAAGVRLLFDMLMAGVTVWWCLASSVLFSSCCSRCLCFALQFVSVLAVDDLPYSGSVACAAHTRALVPPESGCVCQVYVFVSVCERLGTATACMQPHC